MRTLRYIGFLLSKWIGELQDLLRLMLPDKSTSSKVCFGIAILSLFSFGIYSEMSLVVFVRQIFREERQLKETQRKLVQEVCQNELETLDSSALLSDDGEVVQQMLDRIMEVNIDTSLILCIVDSSDVVLAASIDGLQGDSVHIDDRMKLVTDRGSKAFLNSLIPASSVVIQDSISCFLGLSDIQDTPWRILMLTPKHSYDKVISPMKQICTNLLYCLGFLMVCFLVMFVIMRRSNMRRRSIEGEVDVAAQLQQRMVPQQFPAFPDRKDFDLYGVLIPARTMGGDLYDFILRDDKLIFCLGDVSGKGMTAALVMSVVHSAFRAAASHTFDVAEIVSMMNEAVAHGNQDNMFCTLFAAVLDLKNGQLSFCNAGHNLPLVLEPDGQTHFLDAIPNIALGVIEEFPYDSQETILSQGASLLVYTDGVTEAESVDKRLFGDAAVLSKMSGKSGYTSHQQLKWLLSCVRHHARFAEQSDDITMLDVKRL